MIHVAWFRAFDCSTPFGESRHAIYQDCFGDYGIDLNEGHRRITFKQGYVVIDAAMVEKRQYDIDYEFEWLRLSADDIDIVIRMDNIRKNETAVAKFYKTLAKPPWIWLRQTRGAQVVATNLPNDLQRVVFGFLWQPNSRGLIYMGQVVAQFQIE